METYYEFGISKIENPEELLDKLEDLYYEEYSASNMKLKNFTTKYDCYIYFKEWDMYGTTVSIVNPSGEEVFSLSYGGEGDDDLDYHFSDYDVYASLDYEECDVIDDLLGEGASIEDIDNIMEDFHNKRDSYYSEENDPEIKVKVAIKKYLGKNIFTRNNEH